MKTALIVNGFIANVIVTGEGWVMPEGLADEALPLADALAAGLTYLSRVEPVPSEVTMSQFKRAIVRSGLDLATIEAALASNVEALIQWQHEARVRRRADLIVSLAPAFGLTEQQVDDIFRLAAGL